MDNKENPLSLLRHCKVCPRSCCSNSFFVALPGERHRIVEAGYTDHFEDVVLPEEAVNDLPAWQKALVPGDRKFDVLAYEGRYCSYFLAGKGCRIEGVKSVVCRAYPANYLHGEYGLKLVADAHCSAHEKVPRRFLESAEPLVQTYRAMMPQELRKRIVEQFKKQRDALKNDGSQGGQSEQAPDLRL